MTVVAQHRDVNVPPTRNQICRSQKLGDSSDGVLIHGDMHAASNDPRPLTRPIGLSDGDPFVSDNVGNPLPRHAELVGNFRVGQPFCRSVPDIVDETAVAPWDIPVSYT